MLANSALVLFFFLLSGCNKDVLFNLRVSSLTEPGLCKDGFHMSFKELVKRKKKIWFSVYALLWYSK